MVTKYPSSEYFEQALNEQYRIANLYLAGEPQRIWKIPVGPSMDRTIEMYERIIKNAPYGDLCAAVPVQHRPGARAAAQIYRCGRCLPEGAR